MMKDQDEVVRQARLNVLEAGATVDLDALAAKAEAVRPETERQLRFGWGDYVAIGLIASLLTGLGIVYSVLRDHVGYWLSVVAGVGAVGLWAITAVLLVGHVVRVRRRRRRELERLYRP